MRLIDRVREFLEQKGSEIASMFLSGVITRMNEWEDLGRSIESPVEQLFFIAWIFKEHEHGPGDFPLFLEPQYQDESTGKYKLDFSIDFIQDFLTIKWDKALKKVEAPKLGIEIDGHIWHEKTKEQVQYHKERERFLIAGGWKLLRYTGSEAFKDPQRCVEETLELAFNLRMKFYKKLKKELING